MTVLRLTHEPLKITNSSTALQASEPEVVLNTFISHKATTTTKTNSHCNTFYFKENDAHENSTHIREKKKALQAEIKDTVKVYRITTIKIK